jgi:hypothetical protein
LREHQTVGPQRVAQEGREETEKEERPGWTKARPRESVERKSMEIESGVEWDQCPAVHLIPVRHPVDQDIGIVRALAEDWRAGVISFAGDAIDRDTGDELNEIEIVTAAEVLVRAEGTGFRRLST